MQRRPKGGIYSQTIRERSVCKLIRKEKKQKKEEVRTPIVRTTISSAELQSKRGEEP